MVKIGILTFHDGINYGAYLQTYALHNFLLKNGYDNEIINYKSPTFTFNEYKCFLWFKKPVNLYNNILKIIEFKRAHRKLKRTKRIFTSKALERKYFDVVIIGSDSVWNYSNNLSGFEPVYFSKGLRSRNLLSYAASFGPDTYGDNYPEPITSLLKRFDFISVRDANSQKMVEGLTGQKATVVLDPTLLYDFEQETVQCKYDNFVLIYSLGLANHQIEEIIKLAKKANKIVISIGYKNKGADLNIIAASPFEWVGFFKKADFIVTSMYHGVLFSMKYNKQFCTSIAPYRKSKLQQFLIDLELQDRIVRQPSEILRAFSSKIDYAGVNEKINQRRIISENFLKDAINYKKNY